MSNADRIREMTDEELADSMKECPPHREWLDCAFIGGCKECRLDWLRQEAEKRG